MKTLHLFFLIIIPSLAFGDTNKNFEELAKELNRYLNNYSELSPLWGEYLALSELELSKAENDD